MGEWTDGEGASVDGNLEACSGEWITTQCASTQGRKVVITELPTWSAWLDLDTVQLMTTKVRLEDGA